MQVMQCLFLAVTFIAALIQHTCALPVYANHLSTVSQVTDSNQLLPTISKRGLRNLFHRKKKTEEEIQEEAKTKILLSSGPELKSKYLKKLSDEDFHKYMSQHISRLNHVEANKLAKHLEEKAEKHSQTRANGLDAIHAQLKQNVKGYNAEYEKAHWSEVEHGKTSEIAKDINPTVDHLHQVISDSQKEINRLHDASKTLDKHINDLWKKHKWERQQEGKDVKKSTVATLRDAHETAKKIEMYPNLKKTFEAQEAKRAQEAAKAKQQEEEKAQRKASASASASGWPLQGSIGKVLGYKSSSKNSSKNEGSNRSQSSAGSQKGKDKGKLDTSVGGSGSGKQEAGTSDSKSGSERSDEEDGSGHSSGNTSQSNSPTSVLPGYSNPGSKSYYRKSSF